MVSAMLGSLLQPFCTVTSNLSRTLLRDSDPTARCQGCLQSSGSFTGGQASHGTKPQLLSLMHSKPVNPGRLFNNTKFSCQHEVRPRAPLVGSFCGLTLRKRFATVPAQQRFCFVSSNSSAPADQNGQILYSRLHIKGPDRAFNSL